MTKPELVVALLAPFTDDVKIDDVALAREIDYVIVDCGPSMVIAVGVEAQEYIYLGLVERKELVRCTIELIARRGTHVYNELCMPGNQTFAIHVTNNGHFSNIGGGLPVFVDGEIVGGIGVGSGTAEQDLVCAEAAIQHFYAASGRKA